MQSKQRLPDESSSISDAYKPPRRRGTGLATPRNRTTQSGDRLRRFVFTVNNYTDQEYKWFTDKFVELHSPQWFIVGREHGDEGTPHLQGACVLGYQKSFTVVKTWFGFKRAHIEVMRGQPIDSKVYCSKDDQQPFEYGSMPLPGKRKDIEVAVEAINNGETLRDMAMGDHGIAIVKFYKGLSVLRSMRSDPRNPENPPTIYWLYGETGTGKSKLAWRFGEVYGSRADIFASHGDLKWFDGYEGQKVVLIEDFRSKGVAFAFLLRIFDRYPINVPIKGAFANWNPEVIIVTTPKSIRDTFASRLEHRPEDIGQLERRVTEEYQFPRDYKLFKRLITGVRESKEEKEGRREIFYGGGRSNGPL